MEDWHRVLVFLIVKSLCMGQDVVYHIAEEEPSNTYIGILAYDSNTDSVMREIDFNNMRFNILTQGNEYAKYFQIDDKTSAIFTLGRLDREQLCPFLTVCTLTLEVVMQSLSGIFFRILKVLIFLEDINDHSPAFTKTSLPMSISEDTEVGFWYNIEGAVDLDNSDKFSLSSYELFPNNVPFSIQFLKKLDGSSVVRLIVIQPLDRETKELYNMVLIAKDGGDPPLTGRLIINVTITDFNDNVPQFTAPMYNVSLNENIENGSVILTVSATDLDANANGLVHYRLSPHQANEIFQLFAIDEETGETRVIGELVFTHRKVYTIIVEAFDLSEHSLTNQTLIYVSVEDGGNNPPKIHLYTFINSDFASVSEVANLGTVVAYILVTDHDKGKEGEVVCVTNSTTFEIEPLQEKFEYTVIVALPLDHERENKTDVTVICQDNGNLPLTSSLMFFVEISDENDNCPRFTKPLYEASIYEDNKPGQSIVTVKAEDLDSGANADITYRLSSNDSEYVYIEMSGMICAKRNLDRKEISLLYLVVYAVDGGYPQLTGSTTVRIQILNENVEKPFFKNASYEFSISENRPSDSVVGMLLVSDGDNGSDTMILLMIDSLYDHNLPFVVSSAGVILTNKQLDREDTDEYDFNVIVVNERFPMLNSSVHVKVNVDDENDNPPKIYFPSLKNDTVRISLWTTPWTAISRVQASDDDEEGNENSKLKYEITNDTRLFTINFDTGDIQVTDLISEQGYDSDTFNIQIVVSDHGIPAALSSKAMLRIHLYNENVTQKSIKFGGEEGPSTIIITVIVGVVTVVLAGFIAILIYAFRKFGINKAKQQIYGKNAKESKVREKSPTVLRLPSDNKGERKRKVVSFLLRDDAMSAEDQEQHNDNRTEYRSFIPTISMSCSKSIGESSKETNIRTNGLDRGLSESVNHVNNSFSSPRHAKRVHSPMFEQEIIPFSFKKALKTRGHIFEETHTPLKIVYEQLDSGICSDNISYESEPQEYISKDVVV